MSAKKKYEPALSNELREHLQSRGLLDQFLNDYRQMCNNFRPVKIYVPGREPKPKKFEELSDAEKGELTKLGQSYAHALHQLLEFALRCQRENKDYALIGGFGVLGHLYDNNRNFPLKWRGTEDIDLLSKGNLEGVYKSLGYEKIAPEKVDKTMIPDGRLDTYIAKNPYHDRPVKIQDRRTIKFPGGRDRDESQSVHQDKKVVSLYGVPVKVASAEHLIATKTGIRTRKDKLGTLKDRHDIEHLQDIRKLKNRRQEQLEDIVGEGQ